MQNTRKGSYNSPSKCFSSEEWFEVENLIKNNQINWGNEFGISITNQCPLECAHCVRSSESKNNSDKISFKKFKQVINELIEMQTTIKTIRLTGGEPFLIPEKLKLVSEAVEKSEMEASVVTSAFWAKDSMTANKIIEKFPGISEYCISADIFHQKYVPFNQIKIVIRALKNHSKKIRLQMTQNKTPSDEERALMEGIKSLVDKEIKLRIIDIAYGGRAKLNFDKTQFNFSKDFSKFPCMAKIPVLLENGSVIPCCSLLFNVKNSHPLYLGDIFHNSIREIYENASRNALFQHIRLWGFSELIPLIKNSEYSDRLPDSFIEDYPCHICSSLFNDPLITHHLL